MATKYFMSGGVNNNWATDTNWSATSSAGPNDTTHAVAGDDVILDSGSPNCTIAAAAAAATLVCTGYTNVLRFQQNLTLTSTCTFAATQATMTADAITRALVIAAVGGTTTLTAGGNTLPCALALAGSSSPTYSLADAWVCLGVLASNSSLTLNSNTISAVGLTMSAACVGTTAVTLTGGTWSGTSALKNNLTLAGNVTLSGANSRVQHGHADIHIRHDHVRDDDLNVAVGTTFDTGGMTWGSVNTPGPHHTSLSVRCFSPLR